MKEEIRGQYGGLDGGIGPFSVKDYFHYMLNNYMWGDQIMVLLLSSLWSIKITVVGALSAMQYKFRHDYELEDADLVLLFNESENGHYSGVMRADKSGLQALQVERSPKFDPEVDEQERQECTSQPSQPQPSQASQQSTSQSGLYIFGII